MIPLMLYVPLYNTLHIESSCLWFHVFTAQCVVYTSLSLISNNTHTLEMINDPCWLWEGKVESTRSAGISVRSKCDPVSCVEPQFSAVLWVNLLLLFNRNSFLTLEQGCVCRWHKKPLFLFSDLVFLFISTSAFYVDWVSCVSLCVILMLVCVCLVTTQLTWCSRSLNAHIWKESSAMMTNLRLSLESLLHGWQFFVLAESCI